MSPATLLLFVLIIYFAVLLFVSRLTRQEDNNTTFFVGNRNSWWPLVAIGMIGASLSGVSFVSVPGMPISIGFTYMQTVLGFSVGYLFIATVLLPLYYKMDTISIYSYLAQRFGNGAYRTGASFFFISKWLGAAVRLYLITIILHQLLFYNTAVPFWATACSIVALIWCYSHRNGLRTLVFTDVLQTLCLLGSLVWMIIIIIQRLDLDMAHTYHTISKSPLSTLFEWNDWHSTQHFAKQFISGIFIAIAMTGLDQDMMQKNLSCRSLRDAQKNMVVYGIAFIPINFLFLCFGVLLISFAQQEGIAIPDQGDQLLPLLAIQYLGNGVLVLFTIGVVAAAFSSADSSIMSLTTTFCVDLIRTERFPQHTALRIRRLSHIALAILFILTMIVIDVLPQKSVIDAIYTLASYTYGPLLGLFFFGLFSRRTPIASSIPYIAIASPIFCFIGSMLLKYFANYTLGYELLLLNGGFTFLACYLSSLKNRRL